MCIRDRFIHNFKQYAGMSPAQYILSLRMVNAQSLLERTTYNIKEISEIVGYENPLYFSRVVKKEIGKSPVQYRNCLLYTSREGQLSRRLPVLYGRCRQYDFLHGQ